MSDQAGSKEIMNALAFDDGSFKVRYEKDGTLFVLELDAQEVQRLGHVMTDIGPVLASVFGGGFEVFKQSADRVEPIDPSERAPMFSARRGALVAPAAGSPDEHAELTWSQVHELEVLFEKLWPDEAVLVEEIRPLLGEGWEVSFMDLPGGYFFTAGVSGCDGRDEP